METFIIQYNNLYVGPSKIKSLYIIGSLENKEIPIVGNAFRAVGIDAFDNWWAASERADRCWQEYNDLKGKTYKEALQSYEARHVFSFDKTHLDRCDAALLVRPSGKSAHLEAGYMVGKGKPTFVLFLNDIVSKFDVMYNFCTDVYFSLEEAVDSICKYHYYTPTNNTVCWPVGNQGQIVRS